MCLENYLLMLFTRKLLGLIFKNKKSAHLYAGRLIMRGFLKSQNKTQSQGSRRSYLHASYFTSYPAKNRHYSRFRLKQYLFRILSKNIQSKDTIYIDCFSVALNFKT